MGLCLDLPSCAKLKSLQKCNLTESGVNCKEVLQAKKVISFIMDTDDHLFGSYQQVRFSCLVVCTAKVILLIKEVNG